MSEHQVQCSDQIPASADQVWAVVGDFCKSWHPVITSMTTEHDDKGGLVRAFTVEGESTTYRERLTWHSDSEKSLAYTHLDGIAGAEKYQAQLNVTSVNETSCSVQMTASLVASEPRASEIAAGTQLIFENAITAIKKLTQYSADVSTTSSTDKTKTSIQAISTVLIDGTPTLAVSVIDLPASKNNTLCLFIHGIGGNRHNWQQQLTAVAPYCQVAAVDLRGYGDSAAGEHQTTVDDYCADILRVCDTLNADKLILCGLSYGAWIATSFAMRHRSRLAGLVLSGGCTGMSEASPEEQSAFRQSRETPLSQGQTPADFAPAVVSAIAGPSISDPVRESLLASMRAIPTDTYKDALRCFTNPGEVFNFAEITVPVLLMTGDSDRLAPPEEIFAVAKRLHHASPQPDVRFECLANTGHVCNLESPAAYNALLTKFVQRVA